MKLKAPETVFSSAGFCPGCGHGLATRLIGEVSEELGIQEKMLAVVDVACCSFNIDYWRYDTIMAAHGRDIPTAVGVKHIRPENPVFAYLGDGAAYSIGMAETIHAALRNDNICVFVVNNSVFGMTGGQMAPTTLPHQKTATSPKGKDPAKYGTLNVVDVLGKMDIAYLARGELVGACRHEQLQEAHPQGVRAPAQRRRLQPRRAAQPLPDQPEHAAGEGPRACAHGNDQVFPDRRIH